jgi:HAAS domain-containing protein
MTDAETYLAAIATNVRGPGARRLAVELHDHVEDALANGVAPAEVLERLGPPEEALAAWQARIRRRRTDTRRRAAFVAFAVATAAALGVVQHASGHRAPRPACRVTHSGTPHMTARSPTGQVLRGARSGPNGPCQSVPRGR